MPPPPRRPLPNLLPRTSATDQGREELSASVLNLPPRRQPVSQACEGCRKRKVKCDAGRPRCGRCVEKSLDCQYALSQIEQEAQASNYRDLVDLLRNSSQEESMQILERIRNTNDVEGTVRLISEARLLLPAANSAALTSVRNEPNTAPTLEPLPPRKRRLQSPHDNSDFMFEKQFMTHARDKYVDRDIFVDIPGESLPLSKWTQVSDDDQLMNHLLRMFWTWDNIAEKSLYRPIFEEDLIGMNPTLADNGCGSFCSRFLVNALLSLSCLYTMNAKTFKDTEDPTTRGRCWADEADALLSTIGHDTFSFPLLQGLLAMFCYEGNLGLGTKSLTYLFRAIDVYKGLNNVITTQKRFGVDEERTKRERLASSWCIWGFYCFEWRATQALGFCKQSRKPIFPRVWRETDFPLSLPSSSGYWWYPYPMTLNVQKSLKVEIREVDVLLSEIVEEVLDFLYLDENGTPPWQNPQRALELYRAIIDWKQNCPGPLRLEETVLPAAILIHTSAEIMLIAILRPFTGMDRAQFGGKFDPRERCYAHANNLASVVWTFRSFAVIRFEYWLLHALGTSAYIVIGGTEDAPVQMDTLTRSCQCLYEMRSTLPMATDVLCGIRSALSRSKEPIPDFIDRLFGGLSHRKDGLMHHSVASLLPNSIDTARSSTSHDIQLRELLNKLDDIGID